LDAKPHPLFGVALLGVHRRFAPKGCLLFVEGSRG